MHPLLGTENGRDSLSRSVGFSRFQLRLRFSHFISLSLASLRVVGVCGVLDTGVGGAPLVGRPGQSFAQAGRGGGQVVGRRHSHDFVAIQKFWRSEGRRTGTGRRGLGDVHRQHGDPVQPGPGTGIARIANRVNLFLVLSSLLFLFSQRGSFVPPHHRVSVI